MGRTFLPGEDVAGRDRLVVLSDELWQHNFGGDRGIINRNIPLNGEQYTVIGVMPREISALYRTVQMWSPLVFTDKERLERGDHKYFVIGRLKSGVTLTQARQQMDSIAKRGTSRRISHRQSRLFSNDQHPLVERSYFQQPRPR
jgi:putative ABC transport system permease protein